jgi:hypothetical protein
MLRTITETRGWTDGLTQGLVENKSQLTGPLRKGPNPIAQLCRRNFKAMCELTPIVRGQELGHDLD